MMFDDVRIKNHPKLSQLVYETLKKKLISEENWEMLGIRLQEDQLARQFGVSRTPVREAIHRLEKDGLVQIIPRRGAFVKTISAEDVKEIFDLRGALECLALRSSFSSIDRKRLTEMRRLFENCRKDIKEGKIDGFIKLDEEFHRFIVTTSGNQRLIKIMENLDDQIRLARLKSFSVPGRVEKALKEHLEMIDAILAADVEKAEKIILQHSENAKKNILKFLERKIKKGEKNAGKKANS